MDCSINSFAEPPNPFDDLSHSRALWLRISTSAIICEELEPPWPRRGFARTAPLPPPEVLFKDKGDTRDVGLLDSPICGDEGVDIVFTLSLKECRDDKRDGEVKDGLGSIDKARADPRSRSTSTAATRSAARNFSSSRSFASDEALS